MNILFLKIIEIKLKIITNNKCINRLFFIILINFFFFFCKIDYDI